MDEEVRPSATAEANPVEQDEDPHPRGEDNYARRTLTRPNIPVGMPVSATTLARGIDGADIPMPNVLSAKHLSRIGGSLLYAATCNVPWATLLARTFEVDVKDCTRCGGSSRCAPS